MDMKAKDRENSFDLIRHFAAFLVLYSHHFPISGLKEPTVPSWDTFGFVAVVIFFAISGYFMPKSYTNSSGFVGFIVKRCKRIFPGLFVCSVIMVFVVGLIFTAASAYDYIFSTVQFKTVFLFTAFMGRTIPTVFSDFTFKDAINGSLWSLPVEFLCYLIIGSILSLYNSWKSVMCLLWIACIANATLGNKWMDFAFYGVPMSYLSLFGIAFLTGSLMSMTREHWNKYSVHLVLVSLLLIWLLRGRPEVQVFGTASIAVVTIIVGLSFKDKIIRGRFDISYGVYIYAFPIQQIVVNCVTRDFWLGMLLSALLTIVAGSLSYKYVERPFLKSAKSKIKRAEVLATGA
jgi:peptidoglycan/LPS O-acetylase OafA/YrhL